MTNNAQDSQSQSGNLGICSTIYAFATARINPDWISVKAWVLGGGVRVVKIAVADLSALSGQIGDALASGNYVIFLGGVKYQTTETVLGRIRRDVDSYTAGSGVSDAQAVRGGAAILSQSESPSGDTETKASAPQGNASAARQISVEERAHPRFPRSYVRRNSKIAKIAAESIGSAFRDELEPVLDALDDIGAMLSELLAERGIDRAPKQPRGWRKCTVENPLGTAICTKHGRTSVVVGARKISKTTTRK